MKWSVRVARIFGVELYPHLLFDKLYLLVPLLVAMAPSHGVEAQAEVRTFDVADALVSYECAGPQVTVPAWGRFAAVHTEITLNPADLSTASGKLKIDLVSVYTEDSAWDAMFRASTFLEIDQYPHSEFVLKKITGATGLVADDPWQDVQLHGAFTLHGVTKNIIVPATMKWLSKNPARKQPEQFLVLAFFNIKWTDYKINVPEGRPRTFAGNGANIQVRLQYQPTDAVPKKEKKPKR